MDAGANFAMKVRWCAVVILVVAALGCDAGPTWRHPGSARNEESGAREMMTGAPTATISRPLQSPSPQSDEPSLTPPPNRVAHGLVYEVEGGLAVVEGGRTRILAKWSDLYDPQAGYSLSPDGREFAYSRSGQDLWIMDLVAGCSTQIITGTIRAHDADIMSSDWSPDGRWIAFLRNLPEGKAAVKLIPPIGGPRCGRRGVPGR